jgi:hypothetical protein
MAVLTARSRAVARHPTRYFNREQGFPAFEFQNHPNSAGPGPLEQPLQRTNPAPTHRLPDPDGSASLRSVRAWSPSADELGHDVHECLPDSYRMNNKWVTAATLRDSIDARAVQRSGLHSRARTAIALSSLASRHRCPHTRIRGRPTDARCGQVAHERECTVRIGLVLG